MNNYLVLRILEETPSHCNSCRQHTKYTRKRQIEIPKGIKLKWKKKIIELNMEKRQLNTHNKQTYSLRNL